MSTSALTPPPVDPPQAPDHNHDYTGPVPRGVCPGCDWHRDRDPRLKRIEGFKP